MTLTPTVTPVTAPCRSVPIRHTRPERPGNRLAQPPGATPLVAAPGLDHPLRHTQHGHGLVEVNLENFGKVCFFLVRSCKVCFFPCISHTALLCSAHVQAWKRRTAISRKIIMWTLRAFWTAPNTPPGLDIQNRRMTKHNYIKLINARHAQTPNCGS